MSNRKYDPLRDFIVGLEIFAKNGGAYTAAEHDIFYASQGDGLALSQAEISTLKAHGWRIDSELCGGCGTGGYKDDDDGDEHAPTCNGWAKFT